MSSLIVKNNLKRQILGIFSAIILILGTAECAGGIEDLDWDAIKDLIMNAVRERLGGGSPANAGAPEGGAAPGAPEGGAAPGAPEGPAAPGAPGGPEEPQGAPQSKPGYKMHPSGVLVPEDYVDPVEGGSGGPVRGNCPPGQECGPGGCPPGQECGPGGCPPGQECGPGGCPPGQKCGPGGCPPGQGGNNGSGNCPPGQKCGPGGCPPGKECGPGGCPA